MQNGVRVIRLPLAPRFLRTRVGGWWERRSILAWLRRVHASQPLSLIEASDYNGWLSQGGIADLPTVVRIRGSNLFFDAELGRPPQKFEHRHERAALARATHLASVSRYAAERTLAIAGLTGRTCTVIPNGVDASVFSPLPGVAPVPGLITFVNVLNPKKGIEQLLDAANEIFPAFPHAHLAVIGKDTQWRVSGGYIAQLKERIRPEFRERVQFTGHLPREQIADWLRRAAICCYPSHMETFGIAALEAMSVGRPTIFTRLGPGPEIVDDEKNGLLCDPRDPADIARCLIRLLSDPAAAEQLGAAARAHVLAHFDKRDWVQRNLDFYRRCGIPA